MQYEDRTNQLVCENNVIEHPFDADYPPEEAFAQSMEKAIMLTRYVNLMKCYIQDKKNHHASINEDTGIIPFAQSILSPIEDSTAVNVIYNRLFQEFLLYFDHYAPAFTENSDLNGYKQKRTVLLKAIENASGTQVGNPQSRLL